LRKKQKVQRSRNMHKAEKQKRLEEGTTLMTPCKYIDDGGAWGGYAEASRKGNATWPFLGDGGKRGKLRQRERKCEEVGGVLGMGKH